MLARWEHNSGEHQHGKTSSSSSTPVSLVPIQSVNRSQLQNTSSWMSTKFMLGRWEVWWKMIRCRDWQAPADELLQVKNSRLALWFELLVWTCSVGKFCWRIQGLLLDSRGEGCYIYRRKMTDLLVFILRNIQLMFEQHRKNTNTPLHQWTLTTSTEKINHRMSKLMKSLLSPRCRRNITYQRNHNPL